MEKPVDPDDLRSVASRLLRHAKTRREVDRDGLTGLLNRVGLAEAFERISDADDGEGGTGSMAMLRIDALRGLAERRGPDAAEQALLEIAATFDAALEPGDTLARWERSTLVALLPGRGPARAEELLTGVLRNLEESSDLPDDVDAGPASPARGVSVPVRAGADLHGVIYEAEQRLYRVQEPFLEPDRPERRGVHELPRIFLVEDDRVTGTLIRHRLVRDGYEVRDFVNGEEAFAWAAEERFDLAVLDIKVPGMDGFEILERLRGIPRYRKVPIIVLTGMGSEADIIRGLELGADDYMLKPFSPTELLARVRRLLHARSAPAARAAVPGDR